MWIVALAAAAAAAAAVVVVAVAVAVAAVAAVAVVVVAAVAVVAVVVVVVVVVGWEDPPCSCNQSEQHGAMKGFGSFSEQSAIQRSRFEHLEGRKQLQQQLPQLFDKECIKVLV